jgi:rod shape-determining protein MreC
VLLKKRRSILLSSTAAIIILAIVIIPYLRNCFIDSLRLPLEFFSSVGREIQRVTLYHQTSVENQRLKKEIDLIRRQLHEVKEVYLENARLRKLLDFKKRSVYPLTAAGVIGYDPSNLSSIIIINKGRQEAIGQGCAVITNDGLVGRVIEVSSQTSKVLLINNINSGVAALIQRSRQEGLVSGSLAGGLILHYLPSEADVQISDLVITSGLSGLYPKGILIGKVTKIRKERSAGEVRAIVEPSANLTKLEEVLVVIRE